MLVVKIELHSARTGKITTLGQMNITNNGLGNYKRADYDVEVMRKGTTNKVQRRGMVRDYPRKSYTVWELVRRSLKAAFSDWPIHPGYPEEFDEEVNNAFYQKQSEEKKPSKNTVVDESMAEYMNRVQNAQKMITDIRDDEAKRLERENRLKEAGFEEPTEDQLTAARSHWHKEFPNRVATMQKLMGEEGQDLPTPETKDDSTAKQIETPMNSTPGEGGPG